MEFQDLRFTLRYSNLHSNFFFRFFSAFLESELLILKKASGALLGRESRKEESEDKKEIRKKVY